MKRINRFLGFFCCFIILSASVLPVSTFAAQDAVIDTDTASDGYFTVNYMEGKTSKMKVGVTYNNATVYYNYTSGDTSSYTFTEGNGSYTITLFQNISGTSYARVVGTTVTVKMEDELVPYRVSTEEVTFSKDDSVGMKAAEVCKDLTDDSAKVVAIHNYIAANFSYDNDFAAKVSRGEIKSYVPDIGSILECQKGVCYDFAALFAAMCRSQDIPCKIQKGYLNGGYHAWNFVYIAGTWMSVDMTASIAYENIGAESLSECTVVLSTENGYVY